jgi:PKD repeat protein
MKTKSFYNSSITNLIFQPNMKHFFRLSWVMIALVMVAQFSSCKKDEPTPQVIASFTFAVDATNYMKVQFTNASQEYATLAWDFGDGATSTEVSPSHTYAAVGTYTVKLTATNGAITDTHNETVTIADPNAFLTMLVGETSKTWKVLRDVSGGAYPLEVGPYDRSTIWWAVGLNNDELAIRTCILNDEWTFTRDGQMIFDDKGDYWAEGSVYPDDVDDICASSTDPMVNVDGVDVSAWASGNHTFTLTPGTSPTLEVIGTGAFLGLAKVGTDFEFNVPQASVKYDVVSLYDGTTDTLIVESNYKFSADATEYGGYWRFVLVHYDNPADEPPIPSPSPVAGFSFVQDGTTVTFTNTSTLADSYSWDFGDGGTSTEANPVHTYASDGAYTVVLTAVNANGQSTSQATITISSTVLSEAILTNGAWKIKAAEHAVYVGGGMGLDNWWTAPWANFDGSTAGTPDDWSCMLDDEFIFSAGGGYEYKTNGGSRNDGYMGTPNGCWSDAEIAASHMSGTSGEGAAFGSCATHTWAFVPATATTRPIITLTNGAGYAAFIGFMKGYYGGENNNIANQPNGGLATNQYEVMAYVNSGTQELMIVTVDISGAHDGSASWTIELER